jgi:HEAT repeat protein
VDPRVEKAHQVLSGTISQDPQFAQYALDVASRSDNAFMAQLIRDNLAATDYQVALAAARAAARRPSAELEEPLRALYASKSGMVKVATASALSELGDAEAVQWLRDNVQDSTGLPNPSAIRALAAVGEYDVIRPVLNDGLGSQQQEQRDQIYVILGEIDEPWAVELIVAGFNKERGESRREAIIALGRTGDPAHAAKIEKFINTRGLVFATIEALGDLGNEQSVPAVQKMMTRPEKLVKVYAAVALWKLGQTAQAEQAIGELFEDPDRKVRMGLAEQLGTDSDAKSLSILAGLAEDADADVRKAAVRGLRARVEPGLEPILLERLADPDYEVAALALDALATIGTPIGLDAVAALMDHENPYVAISAANAILEISDRGSEAPA